MSALSLFVLGMLCDIAYLLQHISSGPVWPLASTSSIFGSHYWIYIGRDAPSDDASTQPARSGSQDVQRSIGTADDVIRARGSGQINPAR